MGAYLAEAFEKFGEWQWYVIAAVLLLALFGAGMLVAGRKVKWTTHMLASAAMCIALSFVLGSIRLYRMPQGGSITPGSMLPVILFGMANRYTYSIVAGAAWGLLDLMQSMSIVQPVATAAGLSGSICHDGLGRTCAQPEETRRYEAAGRRVDSVDWTLCMRSSIWRRVLCRVCRRHESLDILAYV